MENSGEEASIENDISDVSKINFGKSQVSTPIPKDDLEITVKNKYVCQKKVVFSLLGITIVSLVAILVSYFSFN